jgi:hypothetical protein
MKTTVVFLFLSTGLALAQFLCPPPANDRVPLESLDRKQFLSATNVQRVIIFLDSRWQRSGLGPQPLIERFKKAFESSGALAVPPKKWDRELNHVSFSLAGERLSVLGLDSVPPDVIRWSNIFFLIKDGDFLSFGEIENGFIFFTQKTVGLLLTKQAEPGGPANGSQPIRSETNSTSSAAGSRR